MNKQTYMNDVTTIENFIQQISPTILNTPSIVFTPSPIIDLSKDERKKEYVQIGINRTTYKKLRKFIYKHIEIPITYRWVSITTLVCSIASIFAMLINRIIHFLPIKSSVFCIAAMCSLSLYITNKVATNDWKKKHEQR